MNNYFGQFGENSFSIAENVPHCNKLNIAQQNNFVAQSPDDMDTTKHPFRHLFHSSERTCAQN